MPSLLINTRILSFVFLQLIVIFALSTLADPNTKSFTSVYQHLFRFLHPGGPLYPRTLRFPTQNTLFHKIMVPPLSAVYPLDDEGPIAYLKRQIAIARFSLRTLSAIYQNHQMEIQERATGAETALKSANSTIDDLKTSNVEQTRQIKTQQQIIADKSRIIDEMVAAQALVHSNSIAQEFFGLVAELRSLLDEQASLLLEQNKLLRKGKTMIMVLIDILHEDAATWDGKEKKLSEQIVSLQRVIKEQRTSMAEKVKALDDLAKASASKSTAGSIPPNSPENRQLSDLRQKVAIQGDQIEKLTATITEKKETLESAVAKEFRMSAKIKELKDDISRAKRLEAKLSETVKAREREVRCHRKHDIQMIC